MVTLTTQEPYCTDPRFVHVPMYDPINDQSPITKDTRVVCFDWEPVGFNIKDHGETYSAALHQVRKAHPGIKVWMYDLVFQEFYNFGDSYFRRIAEAMPLLCEFDGLMVSLNRHYPVPTWDGLYAESGWTESQQENYIRQVGMMALKIGYVLRKPVIVNQNMRYHGSLPIGQASMPIDPKLVLQDTKLICSLRYKPHWWSLSRKFKRVNYWGNEPYYLEQAALDPADNSERARLQVAYTGATERSLKARVTEWAAAIAGGAGRGRVPELF